MLESSVDDIKKDFINELKDYLPVLRDKAGGLADASEDKCEKDLKELYRLVHTIKGASSLVKLHDLSEVASELEEIVEAVMHQNLAPGTAVFSAIDKALVYFDAYAVEPACGGTDGHDKKDEVLRALQAVCRGGARGQETGLPARDMGSPALGDEDLPCCEVAEGDVDWTTADGPEGFDRQITDSEEEDVEEEEEDADDIGEIELPQEELLESFYQEAEEHFQDLGKALGDLEDKIVAATGLTPEHKESLRLIRRAVHTIKGAAAVMKLTEISAWGHEFEDLLDWLYEEADRISPEEIKVLAESADLLEQYVTASGKVDPVKADDLRTAFKRIMGSGGEAPSMAPADAAGGYSAAVSATVVDSPDVVPPDPEPAPSPHSEPRVAAKPPVSPPQGKTLRVDMAKVESLVNLTSELIIALSAFDQNMGGLGNVIGEIDRSRQRLKGTARDLELGYEVKAIQHLGAHQSLPPSPGAATGEGTGAFSEFDLLELDRYSEFNLIIRSLNETAVDVSTISTQLNDIHSGFEAYLNRLRLLLSELQEKVMRVRMTPMAALVNRLRRTVRETAAQLGKEVHFSIHGEEIELDKVVWEKLADPLMHLLRNAVDHGIEPPTKRKALGKPDAATVRLSAAYQGNQVVIRITDDGAGLDFEAIHQAAAAITPASKLDRLAREDLAEMIFLPGFSTRRTVSTVSGRGVGMDVVKENIAALKGRVQVEATAKDQGTTFQIRIPLTLAVMRALLFTVAGRLYATALYDIQEIRRVNPEEISGPQGRSLKIGGRTLPFYRLSDYLTGGPVQDPGGDRQTWPLVMVVDTGAWQGAVAIDRLFNQKEIVIKNLGSHLRRVRGIAGATVLGDGRIAPILNLEELLAAATAQPHQTSRPVQPVRQKPLEIMVVDDSVSVRTVVSRLMQRQGWKVQTAKDGVEAMERLHTLRPDLIVLDIEMPRMNGYEFMSAFRARAGFKDTPVVMLTSRAASKHRDKARALGVNGFMTKPYEDGDFISLVKRLTQ